MQPRALSLFCLAPVDRIKPEKAKDVRSFMDQLGSKTAYKPVANKQPEGLEIRIITLLSLIFLGLGLAVALIFFGRELLFSLKDYKIFAGLSGSEWIGFNNYLALWDTPSFLTVVRNTIFFNLLFALTGFALSAAAGSAMLAMPAAARQTVVILTVLPLFMPAEVYGNWWIHLLGSQIFMDESAMRFLHPAISAVKYAGIPILLMYVVNRLYIRRDAWLPLKGAGLFALAALALIGNGLFAITSVFNNPMNTGTVGTMDLFSMQTGFYQMQLGMSTGNNVMQLLLSLVSMALLLYPLHKLYKATFQGEQAERPASDYGARAISLVLALGCFAVIYFLPYWAAGDKLSLSAELGKLSLVPSAIVFIVMCGAGAFASVLAGAAMAGAFLSANRAIVWCAAVMLALITVLTSQPLLMSNYVMMNEAGLMNTVFAIAVATSFSAAVAWALAAVWRLEAARGEMTAVSALSAIGGMLLIQTALNYGNVTPSLLYLTDPAKSPLLLYVQLVRGSGADTLSAGENGLFGFLISMPPLLLAAVAYMLLPKRQLLLVAGGMKL